MRDQPAVTLYDLVFRGDIVLGHSLSDVKARMQQLFKADAAKIDALFSGRPVTLKRNMDEATAKKYQAVLSKAGAEVALVAVTEGESAASAESSVSTQAWSLAPVGSPLLRPRERQSLAPPVSVDISAISLKPALGNLLEAGEVARAPAAEVTVPDFDLAEVGAVLGSGDNDLPLPEVELEGGHWQLSEPGADLLKPEEKKPVQTVKVKELMVDLAPAGSDLGQLKEEKPPLNPDISGLSLKE
ncbi:MAG TPA: hypothetical protein VIC08_05375 [Cellvibrionaceae bacterium]